jgi:structural maintenance of chromosome 4
MPPRRATRQSSASTATVESTPEPAPRVRRQTRASVASSLQDEEDSEDDRIPEEEDSLLDEESDREPVAVKRETRARGSRPTTAPTATVKRSRTSSTKEAVVQPKARTRASRVSSTIDETNEVVVPRRSARLSVTPTPESPSLANHVEAGNGKARRKRVVKSDSEEDTSEEGGSMEVDQDGDETIQAPSTRDSDKMTPQATNGTAEVEEDESEASDVEEDLIDKSLRFAGSRSATPLAAPAKPAEAILQPTTRQNVPVEVKPPIVVEKGPKKRLVIRKMALVNFKSYRGRQEIGPFHKVSRFCFCWLAGHSRLNHLVFLCSLFPRLSDRTVLGNPTLSMRCFSYSVIGPARCDKGS